MQAVFVRLLVVLGLLPGVSLAEESPDLTEEKQKLGYSIGYQVGGDFRRQGMEIDPDLVEKGVMDALEGAEPAMSPEEMRSALAETMKKAGAMRKQRLAEQARIQLESGKAFLAENGQRDGVQTLESGLQYEVLREGEGPKPDPAGKVSVHYRGTLVDGTEFDSSYSRNAPSTFPLGGVIAGWQEGLSMMREGAKWKLFVPPELAYGERGSGDKVPVNATLIFEVELLSANAP